MSLIFENPLSSSLANIPELQSVNTSFTGAAKPLGIENRLMVNTGCLMAYIHEDDPLTFLGLRSELRLASDTIGDDMWYCFDVRCDAVDWASPTLGEVSIWQIHALDSIPGASIDMSATIMNGILKIIVPIPEPPALPITDNLKASYPMPFDRWVRVSMHALWKADDNGVLEVYLDGVPIFRQYNRATCYTADRPYLKIGLYDGAHAEDFVYRRSYYRNLKIYRGLSSYTEVLGDRPQVPLAILA